jgi:hypothetical protein
MMLSSHKLNVKKNLSQQSTACRRLAMVMGCVSKGGSHEVTRSIATTWLKMEDACASFVM